MDLTTFDQLLAPRGQALLTEVQARQSEETELALGTRLRREHSPELVAAAMTQVQLRAKAQRKFGDEAATLYFTPDALEQATRRAVADHRAARLARLGVSHVVDLGCGIGADLLACARAGLNVRGVDLDPVRVAVANANLVALGFEPTVSAGDAETTALADGEVAFVDPARRDGRGRTFSLAALTPSWEFVTGLLAGRAVAKVMPGIAHADLPPAVTAEWVSEGGDLVEASLWGAGFSLDVARRATVLPGGVELTSRDEPASIGDVLSYLVEPDDAVIRAGLVAEFASDIDGHLIDPHLAYVTTDSSETSPLGRWFRVSEELPFREKALRAALREHDTGALTVKKRGVDIVPDELVRRLKLKGSTPRTLILTRVSGEGRAFLVEPVA